MDQQVVETSKEKIKKICDTLRKETLDPALDEAKQILLDASHKAELIIEETKAKAAKMVHDAEKEIEKRQAIFKASLNQAARQSIEWLKQEIEERFLHENLAKVIAMSTSGTEIIARMVGAIIRAIENEGLETDLSAIIPASVDARAVNELLGKEILEKLREKSVLVGPKKGGIEVKLYKENITIDISDTALLELMTRFVRKDFHQFFFLAK